MGGKAREHIYERVDVLEGDAGCGESRGVRWHFLHIWLENTVLLMGREVLGSSQGL